jgi:ribonuclease J
VDGSTVGDISPEVLRDREVLSRDGFVVAIVQRDSETGQVQGRPEIITRGFVFEREAEDLLVGAEDAVVNTVKANHASGKTLRDKVKDALSEYLYRETKRRPMVIPVVLE